MTRREKTEAPDSPEGPPALDGARFLTVYGFVQVLWILFLLGLVVGSCALCSILYHPPDYAAMGAEAQGRADRIYNLPMRDEPGQTFASTAIDYIAGHKVYNSLAIIDPVRLVDVRGKTLVGQDQHLEMNHPDGRWTTGVYEYRYVLGFNSTPQDDAVIQHRVYAVVEVRYQPPQVNISTLAPGIDTTATVKEATLDGSYDLVRDRILGAPEQQVVRDEFDVGDAAVGYIVGKWLFG